MRQEVAHLFFRTGMARAAMRARGFRHGVLPILAYHRVMDVGDEAGFPYDVDLVSSSPESFAWQMEYVKRYFTPITFAQLLGALDGRSALPERPILVTFDDGFDDNYQHAFPVLRALGLPATIFLATGYIGQDRPFWYDWLAYVLLRVRPCILDVEGWTLELGEETAARRRAIHRLVEHLKRVPDARRLATLEAIEQRFGAYDAGDDRRLSRPLSWEQVRTMAAAGIEFGSHTVTHPILANLDRAALEYELTESKAAIERAVGRRVDVLAYPVGGRFSFNAEVVEATAKAGYRLGVSFITGLNRLGMLDRYCLLRIPVARHVDRALFASMLSFPELFLLRA